ncbi:dienelactone hydrolase family protein [Limnobacter sp.]|uniref:dienelactone hydrolase family protein n=1 Tax=Limnobacter sp. TaxID=2003368 RepID=UPI0035176F76
MQSRQVSVAAGDGGQFNAYVSLPPTGTGPGLLLIQEIFGVNQHIRDVADQYAMDGFVVLAPDVFWRQSPGVDLGYDEAGFQKGFALMQGMDFAKAEQDLCAAAKALRQLPEVKGGIASLGFCMGGFLSYVVASNPGVVDAAVCYYGGGIQNALDRAPSVKAPILMHFAEQDGYIPMEAVGQIKQAFASNSKASIHTYPGVDHGFNCWGRPMYQQQAAALARGRTLQFLASALG